MNCILDLPQKSDRAIAEEIGVAANAVRNARQELLSNEQLEDALRIGRDGKSYPAKAEAGPSLLEIDPRPCELCGLTIEHHRMVDHGEGPDHYCLESAETVGWLAARKYTSTNGKPFALGFNTGIDFAIKHLVRQETTAMVEAPPIVPADRDPPRYRTPQATIDAFKYVVATGDLPRVRDWLAARPKDAPFLLALLESQISC